MARVYRRLLPASTPSVPVSERATVAEPSFPALPARSFTNISCESCRRQKAKCTGQRPACLRCIDRGASCEYRTKNKVDHYSILRTQNVSLAREVRELRSIYALIRTGSVSEARDIFVRLRTHGIPGAAAQQKDCRGMTTPAELPTHVGDSHSGIDVASDCHVAAFASRWTAVAGDLLVSELISQFFASDHPYLFPEIYPDTFLEEMATGTTRQAICCSPLLVNAICAYQCVMSTRAWIGPVTRQDMVDMFSTECRRLFALENGRLSLPTSQAAHLMYATGLFSNSLL